MGTIWEDIGELINRLPPKEREEYRSRMRIYIHDLRNKLGVVFSAMGLLERRGGPALAPILQLMRENFQQTMIALEEIRAAYRSEDEQEPPK